MTHDKVRQDFEAWCNEPDENEDVVFFNAWEMEVAWAAAQWGIQYGRAAERAEIREKLESTETLYEVTYGLRGLGWKNNAERAKAAITKILEVI